MNAATESIPGVITVTGQAAADLFDQMARKNMGISGTEFLTRWDRGDYIGIDWDEVPGLPEVAMALPFAR